MRLLVIASLLALSCQAADKSISQARLEKIAHYWQHRLRLDDWDLNIAAVPLDQLKDGTWGDSASVAALKIIAIRVLDSRDYAKAAKKYDEPVKSSKQIKRDVEDTILHELLHLRLRDFSNATEDEMQVAEELTVDRLTAALLHRK